MNLEAIDTDELVKMGRDVSNAIQGLMRAGGGDFFAERLLKRYQAERREIVKELCCRKGRD